MTNHKLYRTFISLWLCHLHFYQAASAFTPLARDSINAVRPAKAFLFAVESNGGASTEATDDSSLPQLPAFEASSHDPNAVDLPASHPSNSTDTVGVVNRKFDLLYTCNKCETRNSHKVSRIAYYKGVVISTCKGCGAQHLIADNLGYTKLWDKEDHNTIEEYLESQDDDEAKVNRVSKDVFHLEQVLGHETDSGSIMGEDGTLAME